MMLRAFYLSRLISADERERGRRFCFGAGLNHIKPHSNVGKLSFVKPRNTHGNILDRVAKQPHSHQAHSWFFFPVHISHGPEINTNTTTIINAKSRVFISKPELAIVVANFMVGFYSFVDGCLEETLSL